MTVNAINSPRPFDCYNTYCCPESIRSRKTPMQKGGHRFGRFKHFIQKNCESTIVFNKNITLRDIKNHDDFVSYLSISQAKDKEVIFNNIYSKKHLIVSIIFNVFFYIALSSLTTAGFLAFLYYPLILVLFFTPITAILAIAVLVGSGVASGILSTPFYYKLNKDEDKAKELIDKYLIADLFKNIYKNLDRNNTEIDYQEIATNIDKILTNKDYRAKIYNQVKKIATMLKAAHSSLFSDESQATIEKNKLNNQQNIVCFADDITTKAHDAVDQAVEKALVANTIQKLYQNLDDKTANINNKEIENRINNILNNQKSTTSINTNIENLLKTIDQITDKTTKNNNIHLKLISENSQSILNTVLKEHQNLLEEKSQIEEYEQEKDKYFDKLQIAVEELLDDLFKNSIANLSDNSKQACYQAQRVYLQKAHAKNSNLTEKLLYNCSVVFCYKSIADKQQFAYNTDKKIIAFKSITNALIQSEKNYF